MYETFFNFSGRPFTALPRTDRYYPAAGIEAARTTLARSIQRAEGVGLVVGPSGTGKTLLCQLLAEQFKGAFQVVLLSCGRLGTRRTLLQAVLYELGQPYRGMDEGELRLSLADYLTSAGNCPRGILLLVDEAHTLPLRLLDEIRTMTNLAQQGDPRVRLVLAGNRALEERFANPKLDSFNQRVVARCYLQPLGRAETQDYIYAQIAGCGGRGPRIFPPEACDSVYKASDGVPRLINQVCDHALLLAYAAGTRQLEPAQIDEAWADLQQLPTPSSGQPPAAGNIIEFGGLEDETAPADGAAPAAADADDGASGAEPAAAGPSLHLMPEGENADLPETAPPEAADLEPGEQLRHIQQMLADVQEEFCPDGPIGPEVELLFDDPAFPFHQEEVIQDRYAPGGRFAAPACDAAAQEPQEPQKRQEPATLSPAQRPYAKPSDDEWDCAASGAPAAGAGADIDTGADQVQEVEIPEVADACDAALEEGDSQPIPTLVPARRQEFGRLFAKLRQSPPAGKTAGKDPK